MTLHSTLAYFPHLLSPLPPTSSSLTSPHLPSSPNAHHTTQLLLWNYNIPRTVKGTETASPGSWRLFVCRLGAASAKHSTSPVSLTLGFNNLSTLLDPLPPSEVSNSSKAMTYLVSLEVMFRLACLQVMIGEKSPSALQLKVAVASLTDITVDTGDTLMMGAPGKKQKNSITR